jgi:Phasin protein
MDEDLELFFKDLGATVKQTVDLARGVEENCFSVVQTALPAVPWIAELNMKAQSCVEQQFDAGRHYAEKLSHTRDFRDLLLIQTEAWQSGLAAFQEQATLLGRAYTKAVADAVNPLPKAA